MAEAGSAAEDGRPGKLHLPRFEDDRFVERHVALFVVLAEEDPEEHGVLGYLHGQIHLKVFMVPARKLPAQTAMRQSTTEPTIFKPA